MDPPTMTEVTGCCPVCGQPGRGCRGGPRCTNLWCARSDRTVSVVHAVAPYEGTLRRALTAYKYRGEPSWAEVFARMLAAHLREHPTWFEEFDLLLGVPAFVGPGSRRRWDPLGSVLGRLAVLLPAGLWEVDPVAVVKRFETPAMTGRSRADRRRIAEGPLRRSLALAGRSCVAGARVLVVDDVLTGGSTMQEMGRLLRSAGAVEVAGLVLARPGWGGVPGGAG